LITIDQAHAIHWKQPMLNVTNFYVVSLVCFAVFALYITLLNRWSVKRDADPEPNVAYWRVKFENLSGFGVVLYAVLLFVLAIYFVMSLDPTWYSTVYGFQYLVGQAFGVLALSILTLIALSKAEPIKSTFRVIEQHDLGKLCIVPDYLVGEFAGRDPVVPGQDSRELGRDCDPGCDLPLAHSVHPAAVAGSETYSEPAGDGLLHHDLRAILGPVLADRAKLQGCGAKPAFQLGNPRIHRSAGSAVQLLAGLLLQRTEAASADRDQRSASCGDSGA
jgi:hypothetical protein